jgi:stress response protein YsnF
MKGGPELAFNDILARNAADPDHVLNVLETQTDRVLLRETGSYSFPELEFVLSETAEQLAVTAPVRVHEEVVLSTTASSRLQIVKAVLRREQAEIQTIGVIDGTDHLPSV